VVTLSAGLLIGVAISRARVTLRGEDGAEVRHQRFSGGGRKPACRTDFEPFHLSCPDRLFDPDPGWVEGFGRPLAPMTSTGTPA
jgi:hypothetical protein